MAAVWGEVLGRSAIRADENFFELGGDSLTATRILSRLRQVLPVAVTMEQILSYPTIAGFAEALERSAIERGAVERSGAQRSGVAREPVPADASAVAPASANVAAPSEPHSLSYAQEWLWTLHDLNPGSPAYHLPLAVRLRGVFDEAAFGRALGEVVARQEGLRTVFPLTAGRRTAVVRPVSTSTPTSAFTFTFTSTSTSATADTAALALAPTHVSASVSALLPLIDLSSCQEPAKDTLTRHAVAAAIARPFDLAAAPPWRVCVVRLDERDHVVLFVLHHIIADGWSMSLLVNEVTTSYVAGQGGVPRALPPLPIQYREFAERQRATLERDGDALVAYWKRQLKDVPPLLTVSHRPRPSTRSYRGGRHTFRVEADLIARLTELARREQATLFMVLMAAYQVLLFRLTGQEDFCVGAPTAGRLDHETEPLIGCFISTLPVRADLRGNPTFLELLQRVRRTTLDAFAHQALPFGQMVQELRPNRAASYTPFFQVVLDVNSTPPPSPPEWPTLSVEPFGAPMPTAKTDLILDLWRGADGEWLGGAEYDLALFDERDVERLIAGLLVVMDAAARNPDERLTSFDLESSERREAREQARQKGDAARRQRLASPRARKRVPVSGRAGDV